MLNFSGLLMIPTCINPCQSHLSFSLVRGCDKIINTQPACLALMRLAKGYDLWHFSPNWCLITLQNTSLNFAHYVLCFRNNYVFIIRKICYSHLSLVQIGTCLKKLIFSTTSIFTRLDVAHKLKNRFNYRLIGDLRRWVFKYQVFTHYGNELFIVNTSTISNRKRRTSKCKPIFNWTSLVFLASCGRGILNRCLFIFLINSFLSIEDKN